MVYTDYWGLAFHPFANDNRADTFVPTHSATLCIGRLRYALGMGMGASALYGEAGVGKTRVARAVLREFAAARWLTCYLPNPAGRPRDVLTALSREAGLPVPPETADMAELQRFLLERTRRRQPVLLAVDDAHTARGTDFLEMLRTLLNVEDGGARALSILLLGQPGMERKLRAASRFDGQLAIRALLEPMREDETRLYILARLKAAGSGKGIFTRQAAELVVQYSGGLPRQVNRLCELSLVVAYGLEERKVTPEIVTMAAADLDLLPAGEAAFFPWPRPERRSEPEPEPEPGPAEEDILANLPADG